MKFSPVFGDDILHDGYVPSSALFEVILIRVNFTCLILRHCPKGFETFQQSGLSLQFPFQPVCALHSLRNVVWYRGLTTFNGKVIR